MASQFRSLLLGRIALVTGGGSGIGRAICKVLSREGANVIVADKNEIGAQETLNCLDGEPQNHIALSLDVSVHQSVEAAIQSAVEKYSRPPCLVVNCAGITLDNFLFSMSEEDFDKVIDVNLKGTFLVTKSAAAAMTQAGIQNGAIVNIASIAGKCGNIGQANYAASKAGVIGLTKATGLELAKVGIRCNVVLPGFIETPMMDTVPDKVKAIVLPRIPLKRLGNPEEVAEVVAFLLSDRASYMTGACVDVAGGLNF